MKYIKSNIGLMALILFSSFNLVAQNYLGKQKDIDAILKNIENFSQYYMNADYQMLAACYSIDGKIFPNNAQIIEGRDAIEKRWTLPQGVKILKHQVTPIEIKVINEYAYDYGIYEGETLRANGSTITWKGKYVIVWKKIDGEWKIYLDIWNNIKT